MGVSAALSVVSSHADPSGCTCAAALGAMWAKGGWRRPLSSLKGGLMCRCVCRAQSKSRSDRLGPSPSYDAMHYELHGFQRVIHMCKVQPTL